MFFRRQPLPLFLFLSNRPAAAQGTARATAASTVNSLLGNPSFLLLILFFTLPAMAAWIVRDWMPDILRERFALGQGKAGVSAVLYWQLAAIVGAVLGGWLADRWMRTNVRGRIFVSIIGTSLLLPALFGVGNAATGGQLGDFFQYSIDNANWLTIANGLVDPTANTVTISGLDVSGSPTVYLRAVDAAGNTTTLSSQAITYDGIAPTGTFSSSSSDKEGILRLGASFAGSS